MPATKFEFNPLVPNRYDILVILPMFYFYFFKVQLSQKVNTDLVDP